MRRVSRRGLLGLRVQDCHGEEIGRVVDTWPDDGGFELEFVVVRLPRLGERRMLPAAELVPMERVLRASFSRTQIAEAPEVDGGRHSADDPWRAKAYWMFVEPPPSGSLRAPWRRSSGSSVTAKRSLTSPRPTPTAS
jgi:hypothetical protein